jgi:hypothetical protein
MLQRLKDFWSRRSFLLKEHTAVGDLEGLIQEVTATNAGRKLVVDREKAEIHDVKIVGIVSANGGRQYPVDMLRRHKHLYEGAKCYVNHATDLRKPRGYEELLGGFTGIYEKPDGLYAQTFSYKPKHPLAESVIWDAEHGTFSGGFSHMVKGKQRGALVEAIENVFSVDLVADGATTKNLGESRVLSEAIDLTGMGIEDLKVLVASANEAIHKLSATTETDTVSKPTIDDVKKDPALVEAILSEHRNSESAKARDAEFKTLKEENEKFKAEAAKVERRKAIDAKLKEAKLPPKAITDIFVETCMGASDDAKLKAIIDDRKAAFGMANRPEGPESREQSFGEALPPGDYDEGLAEGKKFVASRLPVAAK